MSNKSEADTMQSRKMELSKVLTIIQENQARMSTAVNIIIKKLLMDTAEQEEDTIKVLHRSQGGGMIVCIKVSTAGDINSAEIYVHYENGKATGEEVAKIRIINLSEVPKIMGSGDEIPGLSEQPEETGSVSQVTKEQQAQVVKDSVLESEKAEPLVRNTKACSKYGKVEHLARNCWERLNRERSQNDQLPKVSRSKERGLEEDEHSNEDVSEVTSELTKSDHEMSEDETKREKEAGLIKIGVEELNIGNKGKTKEERLCHYCKKPGHLVKHCRRTKICHNCHKKGHIKKECRNNIKTEQVFNSVPLYEDTTKTELECDFSVE